MPGPLDGVKVVEFTEIIAGPLAGMLLADLGAQVIKVEPPWGEPWRYVQSFSPTESRVFMAYNKGKRGLTLDLNSPQSRQILERMIPDTDVVLVNYRPDVVVKLGLDYETLSALNPRLVYCDLTAYGRQGPDAHLPSYDVILQALSGLMTAEGKMAGGTPLPIVSTPLIDTTSGFSMAWCVCAGLFARERTGLGQKVETTLLGTTLAHLTMRFLQVESIDRPIREQMLEDLAAFRAASVSHEDVNSYYQDSHAPLPGNIYYRVYATQDGAIAVGCLSDPLRRRLLDVLGMTDNRFEPGYDPTTPESRAFGRELEKQAEGLFLEKSASQWLETLESRGIPAGPVRFIEEMVDHPQVKAAGLVIEVEHKEAGLVKTVGPLARFNGEIPPPVVASPALGQHNDEILSELGYSPGEVNRWRKDRVVG
ncbi:MAG TPA: CoA transferase [Dehalococcoidia bacterium]|nr:CoA transferase [Dehalococcoidia bacterium]